MRFVPRRQRRGLGSFGERVDRPVRDYERGKIIAAVVITGTAQ
jgi:hypothetical protein